MADRLFRQVVVVSDIPVRILLERLGGGVLLTPTNTDELREEEETDFRSLQVYLTLGVTTRVPNIMERPSREDQRPP